MAADIKLHIHRRIENALKCYVNDFEALPIETLGQSPGGVARCPYDFTYEVVYLNRRIAMRLRGEDPGPSNHAEGWAKAPPEFMERETCLSELQTSATEVVEAWQALPDEEVDSLKGGSMTSLDLASLCASHLTYHDAQLNYLQTLDGDEEMHWD